MRRGAGTGPQRAALSARLGRTVQAAPCCAQHACMHALLLRTSSSAGRRLAQTSALQGERRERPLPRVQPPRGAAAWRHAALQPTPRTFRTRCSGRWGAGPCPMRCTRGLEHRRRSRSKSRSALRCKLRLGSGRRQRDAPRTESGSAEGRGKPPARTSATHMHAHACTGARVLVHARVSVGAWRCFNCMLQHRRARVGT
eukprot:366361-Chlamydomonas_euryale.AAC.4